MKIALSKIKPSPEPVRKSWSDEKMDELVQSIMEQGVIVPPKVQKNGKGYEVIYGHRRLEAARRAGLTEMECIVEEVDNPIIQALIENVLREDMNDRDIAEALQTIKDAKGYTNAGLGRAFGWKHGRVGEFLALLKPEYRDHDISASTLSRVSRAGVYAPRVAEKAAEENLTELQTKSVAEAVHAAGDPKTVEKLLKTPYSTTLHDADLVTAMADIRRTEKKVRTEFSEAVSEILRLVTRLDAMVTDTLGADKFSPEAKRFTIRKLNKIIERISDGR